MGITDWNRPARAVHDWIRALTWPYPGAFTFLAGRKVMLWASAVPGAAPGPAGATGEVLGWDADGVRVGTAAGVILLTSMSDADGAAGPAAAWAERNGVRPGEVFEPVSSETAAWALGLGPKPAEDLAR
jgi:methionyl-tRNA formyltransferase